MLQGLTWAVYNQEFSDEISYQADTILKNCKNYFSKSLASIASDVKADFSTLFYNIDGNKSNFDKFATELSATSVTFSVIGLAETNVSKTELAPLYNFFFLLKTLKLLSKNYTIMN